MDLLIAYVLGIFTALKTKFPLHKPIDGTEPKADAAQEQHNAANILPAIHQSGVANIAKNNTCQCCHHKTPRWKIVLDWLTFIVTSGAFISAAIYAIITSGQLVSMNKTFGEIEKQTTIQRKVNELNRLIAQRSFGGAPLDLYSRVYDFQSPLTSFTLQFFSLCSQTGKRSTSKTVICPPGDERLIYRTNIVLRATFDFRTSVPSFDDIPDAIVDADEPKKCDDPKFQQCIYSLPKKQLLQSAFNAYLAPGSKVKLYVWGRAAYIDTLGTEGYDFCKWISADRLRPGISKRKATELTGHDFLVDTADFRDCDR